MSWRMRYGKSWGQLGMKYKLSEVMDVIGGGTPKTSKPEYWNGDIPWLSVKDFNNDYRYVYRTEKSITKEGLENSTTKLLDKGDMIISARGTVGEVASVPYPMAFNQSCYGLRAKSDLIVSDFLYYLIKYNVNVLKKQTHGSVFDTITRNTFDDIEVDIPDFDCQKKIASLLSDLDAKIELNIKINENLEQQLQLLYDQLTYDLKGETIELSSVIEVRDGTHDSPKPKENGFPLVTSKHLLPFSVDLTSCNLISQADYNKINERSAVDTYDILLSMIGTVGLVSLVIENPVTYAIKNVGLFKTSKRPELYAFILAYLKSKKTMQHIEKTLAGSTQKYISLGELRKMPIILPTVEQLSNYNEIANPLIKQIITLTNENKTLNMLRDSILPKLMSGEIDVSAIDI